MCALSVRRDGRLVVQRRVARVHRLPVAASSPGGRRHVAIRCGRSKAFARFDVIAKLSVVDPAPSPMPVLADSHDELGAPPVAAGETDAAALDKSVGGDSSTRIPLDRGRAVRVTQAPSGPYSHGTQYTRNAVDLGLPMGTVVRAGFSGVVAVARGGCAVSGSYGCNAGYGNFVYETSPASALKLTDDALSGSRSATATSCASPTKSEPRWVSQSFRGSRVGSVAAGQDGRLEQGDGSCTGRRCGAWRAFLPEAC
jgi:hypothetical protein